MINKKYKKLIKLSFKEGIHVCLKNLYFYFLFRYFLFKLQKRWKQYLIRQVNKEREKLKKKHYKNVGLINVKQFTIISSNCWGGSVYEDLKIQYSTPTVGLFFFAPCFISFLKDLNLYIASTPKFINRSKYPEANSFIESQFWYPIGLLNENVEIHFLHYKSEKEALEKWERRKQRIVWENLHIACTDRDRMTAELMKEFDHLPFKNKILFSAKSYLGIKSLVVLKSFNKCKSVGDLYMEREKVSKNFKIYKWIAK